MGPVPVTASMRRRLDPIDASDTIFTGPMSPRARTWVPPHSSVECGPASSTRTMSPYLSPKKAMAPSSHGLGLGGLVVADGVVGQDLVVGEVLDGADLLGGERVGRAEVEAQAVGVDQGALLLDGLAEHLAQRPVEDVGAGVVAADGVAPLDVDGGGGLLAGLDGAVGAAGPRGGAGRAGRRSCRAPRPTPVSVLMVPVSPTCPPDSA